MSGTHRAIRSSENEVVVRYDDTQICRLTSRPPLADGGSRLWLLDDHFPLEAERIYRAGATALPEEQVELDCFLARLYYLLSRPTRMLRPSAFSNRPGRSGEPTTLGRLSEADASPIESMIGTWSDDTTALRRGIEDDRDRPFWGGAYVDLLKSTDTWLAGGPGPGYSLQPREVELAVSLCEAEGRFVREIFEEYCGTVIANAEDAKEVEAHAARALRRKLVDNITAYRSQGTPKWEGLEEALPRLLWVGRDRFLLMYFLAAQGIYQSVLRDQLEWSRSERWAYHFMHTHVWNGGLMIPRVDPYFREFLFFDTEETVPIIRRLAFKEIAATAQPETVSPLSALWYVFLLSWRLHVLAEAGANEKPDRETPLEAPRGDRYQDEQGADVTEATIALHQWWHDEEVAEDWHTDFRAALEPIMRSLSERDRRILQLVFEKGDTQVRAAEVVGVDPATVSRAISRFSAAARELLDPDTP